MFKKVFLEPLYLIRGRSAHCLKKEHQDERIWIAGQDRRIGRMFLRIRG
jgi:hypothetical protein